SMQAQEFPWTF
nr:immunoglobulin light chain junction region [Macaca mulatta]